MTDNSRPRDAGQDSTGAATSSGAGPDSTAPKRRRRRRRSRRRGSGTGAAQRQTGTTPQAADSDAAAGGAGEKSSRGAGTREGTRSGGTGGQGRHSSRRRAGRSGKSSGGAKTTKPQKTTAEGTGPASHPKQGGEDGGTTTRNRRRGGRNRRGGQQGKGSQGPSAPGRRPSRGQPRGGQHSRMQTRDETSAGGLVVSGLAEAVDDKGNVELSRIYVALIGRLDRRGRLLWSMPKGHVEPDEEHGSTAEREVWEETGIYGEVFAELGVIDYWFVSDGCRIHKTVYHHLLRYVDGDLNDEDPEVTEVSWIPVSELIEHLAYADERKLARIAHDLLPDLARKEKTAGRATPR